VAPCLGRLKCAGCSFAPVLVLHSIRFAPPSDTRFALTDTAAASECKDCVAGKYLSDTATDLDSTSLEKQNTEDDCRVCTRGSYSSSAASEECTVCPSGKYLAHFSPDATSSADFHDSEDDCTSCGSGKFLTDDRVEIVNHVSADSCLNCDAGTYSAEGAAECTNCDAGKYSGKESDPTRNKRGSLLRPA